MPNEIIDDANKEPLKESESNGFLSDLTDGRPKGIWSTRYPNDAQHHIHWEKKYLIVLFIVCISLPLLFGIITTELYESQPFKYQNLKKYFFSFFGGTLGGTLFAMKWLVHSVAKNSWNLDRQLWRILTPFLSGGLALIVIILINCQLFNVSKPENITIHKSYGIGFLVGYFSDNAIGKLTEIAQVLFGSTISKRK